MMLRLSKKGLAAYSTSIHRYLQKKTAGCFCAGDAEAADE